MDWLKIAGKVWNVEVLDIRESFQILYSEKTGRSISIGARMILDPLGTFYGHKITVGVKKDDITELDKLFEYVSKPRYDGVMVEAVHGQKTIVYEAYISSGERAVRKINKEHERVYYDSFELNIIPMEAQVKP